MRSIYSYFYAKQPETLNEVLPDYEHGKFVTFLNPYSAEIAKKHIQVYSSADYICSDGVLPILLNKVFRKNKTQRISFDMTSLAPHVFRQLSQDEKTVFFIGSTIQNITEFVRLIKSEYPSLNVSGYSDGYVANKLERVCWEIIEQNPSTVIVGMGTPLQDLFALKLKEMGYNGNVYTCGGFFHQTTQKIQYYPPIIDKLNLRWLYRIINEKYVLKRIVFYYPTFVLNYILFLFTIKSNKN